MAASRPIENSKETTLTDLPKGVIGIIVRQLPLKDAAQLQATNRDIYNKVSASRAPSGDSYLNIFNRLGALDKDINKLKPSNWLSRTYREWGKSIHNYAETNPDVYLSLTVSLELLTAAFAIMSVPYLFTPEAAVDTVRHYASHIIDESHFISREEALQNAEICSFVLPALSAAFATATFSLSRLRNRGTEAARISQDIQTKEAEKENIVSNNQPSARRI